MDVSAGLTIGVLTYIAVGVVVLARAEGGSALGTALDLNVLSLLAVLAWPLLLALRRWPANSPEQSGPVVPDQEYVGVEAVTVSDLRPWGKVRVSERHLAARAETGFVAAGVGVRVIGVDRGGLIVRHEPADGGPACSPLSNPAR